MELRPEVARVSRSRLVVTALLSTGVSQQAGFRAVAPTDVRNQQPRARDRDRAAFLPARARLICLAKSLFLGTEEHGGWPEAPLKTQHCHAHVLHHNK